MSESLDVSDSVKVNLLLFGIITLFVFLTLIAYLLTDGRDCCLIPMVRRFCPRAKWTHASKYDKRFVELDMTHHVFGVKKSCNISTVVITNNNGNI